MYRPKPHFSYRWPVRMVPSNAVDLRREAEQRAAQATQDPLAWIALSNACAVLADTAGMTAAAERAYELAPDDPASLRQWAQCLTQIGHRLFEAEALYDRLFQMAPDDTVGLHYRYIYAMLSGNYRAAIENAESFDRLHPNDPQRTANIARALRLRGEEEDAREQYRRAAELCDDVASPFPEGRAASMRPIYTALAGDPKAAERYSTEICRDGGLGLADPDHPRYPPGWLDSMAKARARVRGCDLYVFGNGPSLADAAARHKEMADLDFFVMTMSTFQLAEQDILAPIGKSVDFVCVTHPGVLADQSASLRSLFARSPEAALVMPIWLRELEEANGPSSSLVHGHVLWFDCYGQHPAHPGEPLHVPAVNTLLGALCTALLLEPRRIFLFGFDGRIKGEDSQAAEALYYKEHDPSYLKTARGNPAARELTRKWLWWDSLQFNEVAPHALRHTALLFDLDLPPIYNVCPGSALTPFPRVSFERFLEIARDGEMTA